VDDWSSDSESNTDDDDYETVFLDCEACIRNPFSQTVSDADHRSTSGRVLVDKPETETANNTATSRSNTAESSVKDRVIVVWGSYDPEPGEPEPEVHEKTNHVTQSATILLPCLEEVRFLGV